VLIRKGFVLKPPTKPIVPIDGDQAAPPAPAS